MIRAHRILAVTPSGGLAPVPLWGGFNGAPYPSHEAAEGALNAHFERNPADACEYTIVSTYRTSRPTGGAAE